MMITFSSIHLFLETQKKRNSLKEFHFSYQLRKKSYKIKGYGVQFHHLIN